jgi:hypothetical protein
MTARGHLPERSRAVRALSGAAALLDAGPGPARVRTIVRLLRHALEVAVDAFWESTRPGEVAGRSRRGRQIRLLAASIDRRTAHDVYATWCMLSDAAKPHPYELAPTVGELRALQAATQRHVAALEHAGRSYHGQ